jgi:hypothetical protein
MKPMIGQKHYGKVMTTSYETLIKKQKPDYRYLIEYSNNEDVKKISWRIYDELMIHFDEEIVHFLCSWYCHIEVDDFELFGYNCYYYDVDPLVCKVNKNITNNVINKDVIFDDIKINEGIIVNKYCEVCYPIGKIFKGKFVLVGSDNSHLSCINHIKSCQQLIDQNELSEIYYKTKIKGKHNYYMVVGCNQV